MFAVTDPPLNICPTATVPPETEVNVSVVPLILAPTSVIAVPDEIPPTNVNVVGENWLTAFDTVLVIVF